jgi:Chaperone of endosialidase
MTLLSMLLVLNVENFITHLQSICMKKITLLFSLFVILNSVHAQAPVNDEPCDAIDVPVLPAEPLLLDCEPTTIYSYVNATLTAAIPNPTCVSTSSGIRDVWYKFIVPASGSFVINTKNVSGNINHDLVMSIYSASSCNGVFTQIACQDDFNGLYPRIQASAVAGQIIYIRIFHLFVGISNAEFKMCISDYSINNNPLVDNTSKVGIGTTSPLAKLDVAGTGLFRDKVTFVKDVELRSGLKLNTNAGLGSVLTSDASGNASWLPPVVPTNYWSLNGSGIINNNGGNVGINFSGPVEKLHVNGNIKLGNEGTWGSSGAGDRLIKFGDADLVSIGERFGDDQLHLRGNISIIFRTGGDAEKMRIDNNGNVGLGLINPTYKLHLGNSNNGLRIEGPTVANSGGSALNIGGFGDVVVDKPGTVGGRFMLKESGDAGFGTATPNAYGHGGNNRIVEIRNFSGTGSNVQSHLMLSTTGNAGSLGGITWASTALSGEQRTSLIANAFETANRTRLSFYARNDAGLLAEKFYISGDGSAWLQGTLTQNSDSRLKKKITPINNALQSLTQLSGYNYYWKNTGMDNSLQTGVLAQEVQKIFPNLVKSDTNGTLSVNYNGLIPVMIESIKEQQKQIDELKLLVQKLLNK